MAKVEAVPSPQSREELSKWLFDIGVKQRELDEVETRLNNDLEARKQEAADEVAPIRDELSRLVRGAAVFCDANRQELTDGGKTKTVKLDSGEVRWRFTPPKVSLRGVEAIVAVLRATKRKGLKGFLRKKVTYEVNKEAMLEKPQLALSLDGVTITRTEELIFKPTELEVEIVGSSTKAALDDESSPPKD